jgi:hypothetical protein
MNYYEIVVLFDNDAHTEVVVVVVVIVVGIGTVIEVAAVVAVYSIGFE